MKVGDYVRTKNGKILKITKLDDDYIGTDYDLYSLYYDDDKKQYYFITDSFDYGEVDKHYIIKSSPNPTELLKVGDVIRVFSDLHDLLGNALYEIKDENHLKHLKNGFDNGYYHLISVVTKEQFKSMEYEVE